MLQLALELLKPEDQQVIILRDWQGLAFDEISEELGIETKAANKRYHRAVIRLGDQVVALRNGELDAELIYAKRVRKGSLERYTATSPPHVQAARKAAGKAGPVVRYVITNAGPEPVLPGRPLPPSIDHNHYIERVLRPVADAILVHVGQSFDEAEGQPRQLDLL